MYTTFGVMRLAAHCVRWTVRSIGWLADSARNIQASGAGGIAAISYSAGSDPRKRVPVAAMRRPLFPDIAISVREASEALFAHQRLMFYARSEMRETAARTREIIAQSRTLMAHADAVATTRRCPLHQIHELSHYCGGITATRCEQQRSC